MTNANQKLQAVREDQQARFAERDSIIDGILTAMLAGQHTLLLGPPGTAKSALARSIADATADGSFFQWLLTKFSTPEELFGPISFTGLKEDRYERVTTGKLPEAKVVFLDEIFKANSSVLNALLTALNERLMFNGDRVEDLPLLTCIGASNEYPESDSLDALYDRFMMRYWVDYVSDRDALAKLLTDGIAKATQALTDQDVKDLREQVEAVPFNGSEAATLLNIKAALEEEGFTTSDRTWVNAVKLVKARAVLNGRDSIVSSDYMVLADSLWKLHKDRAAISKTVGNAADPFGSRAEALIDAVRTAAAELPDISLVKSGQLDKVEAIDQITAVNVKLNEALGKVEDIEKESTGNERVAKARKQVDDSLTASEELTMNIMRIRG